MISVPLNNTSIWRMRVRVRDRRMVTSPSSSSSSLAVAVMARVNRVSSRSRLRSQRLKREASAALSSCGGRLRRSTTSPRRSVITTSTTLGVSSITVIWSANRARFPLTRAFRATGIIWRVKASPLSWWIWASSWMRRLMT